MASMLTTQDNPYNPYTQFDDWFAFDEQMGYHTCAYLARVAKTSPDIDPIAYNEEIDRAIDSICRFDVTGKYKKLSQ